MISPAQQGLLGVLGSASVFSDTDKHTLLGLIGVNVASVDLPDADIEPYVQ